MSSGMIHSIRYFIDAKGHYGPSAHIQIQIQSCTGWQVTYCTISFVQNTCDGKFYNGRSANLLVRLTSSDWLKVDFWIHGPVAAGTSYSESLLFIGLPLCDVSAATGPMYPKTSFQSVRIYLPYAQIHAQEWLLDMYPSAGHSIAWHSVYMRCSAPDHAGGWIAVFCSLELYRFSK